MGQSPSKGESKKSPLREQKQQSDGNEIPKIDAESTIVRRAKAKREIRERELQREKDASDNGVSPYFEHRNFTFSSKTKDVLEKAMRLAQGASSNDGSTSTQAAKEISGNGTEQPESIEISMERLRDTINQHPDEFWKTREGIPISGRTSNTNPILLEQNALSESHKKRIDEEDGDDDATTDSKNPPKRRKLQHPNSDPLPSPQVETAKQNDKQVFTSQDRAVLRAVQSLLEESLQNLTSSKIENISKRLLEYLKAKQSSAMEIDTEGIDVQEMAHKVTLSFANDLSDLLKAIDTAKSCIPDKENAPECPKENLLPSTKPIAVEASLLCDEQDLVQFREEESRKDDDDESDKDENDLRQHLLCHENEESLFGKPVENETRSSNDLLIAQKVALIRETKRLIRAKTMVLTKRRLGIQEEEDLSLLI